MEAAQNNQLCSSGMEVLGSYRTEKGKLWGWKIRRTGQLPCSLEVVDTSGYRKLPQVTSSHPVHSGVGHLGLLGD